MTDQAPERADRMPLMLAELVMLQATLLLEISPTDSVVGSIRRRCLTVKDIDLLAPMPQGDSDPLYAKIARCFESPLVAPPKVPQLFGERDENLEAVETVNGKPRGAGRIVKGGRPGFRNCTLSFDCPLVQGPVQVEIWRYDPGPEGNRGWIELIRTGPWEFAKLAVSRWTAITGGRSGDPHQGYPRTTDGHRVPVPDEAAAFKLLNWPYIDPWNRQGRS